MKLLVTCFLAIAFNYVSSLPTNAAVIPVDTDVPTIIDNASKLISSVRDAAAPTQSSVTIHGNVTIQIIDNKQPCGNQENSTENHTPPKLPDGYETIFENDEYVTGIKLHATKEKFNSARKICAREGAFLAYTIDRKEEQAILGLMERNRISDIWTGIHNLFEQFDWSTILGEVAQDVAYFTWRPGQPDNAGGNERCTHFRNDGYNDISCASEFAFICKIKLPFSL